MEGKLKKIGNEYKLYAQDDSCIATSWHSPYQRLSKKNCEAVVNGYDLDELAREACDITDPLRLDSQKYKQDPYFKIGFIKGFQKALSILGDKKFSEKDMSKAWSEGYHRKVDELNGNGLRYFDKFIQSLQQTEWDVEVEMEDTFIKNSDQYIDEVGVGNYSTHTKKPKLDSKGCLILRRK